MKQINLTRGLFAEVDDADFEFLSSMNWHAVNLGHGFYAVRNARVAGKRTLIGMHRMILGFPNTEVDHIDGNTLNNQRANLRKASKNQNQHNRVKNSNGSSRFKGVSWDKTGKWRAQIRIDGIRRHLGTFADEESAAKAYDFKAKEVFGEFAKTNF